MLILGDCLEKLKELEDNSVDAIVTDPPYGLGKEPNPVDVMKGWIEKDYHEVKGKGFMGKEWDAFVPQSIIWKECLRVLKPGGYLLAFAGTRTQDWMAMSLRFAGFEIRDLVARCYGSGFPKSLNIGKAVDKIQGNEGDVVGEDINCKGRSKRISDFVGSKCGEKNSRERNLTKGTSEWEGWGTSLKPAIEPVTMARKPLEKGLNVAQNCLKWGVGGINIDESRVEGTYENEGRSVRQEDYKSETEFLTALSKQGRKTRSDSNTLGRFPANLILEDCEEVKECFPESGGGKAKHNSEITRKGIAKDGSSFNTETCGFDVNKCQGMANFGDSGNASRFFKSIIYQAKASKSERNKGCEGLEEKLLDIGDERPSGGSWERRTGQKPTPTKNIHPTVKPVALMEYLINMVSREGGVILDPFMGSGTTGLACKNLNRDFIGIELDENYYKIAEARINQKSNNLFDYFIS